MELTVYLVDRGGDREKAINSLKELEPVIVDKPNGTTPTSFSKCETDWYMVLFSDEYLEEKLRDAIPFFMESDFEYFNVYRMMDDGVSQRYFVSPRLFRNHVVLNKHGEVNGDYVGTSILDGFIFHQ